MSRAGLIFFQGHRLPILAAGLKQANRLIYLFILVRSLWGEFRLIYVVMTLLLYKVTLSCMNWFLRYCHVECVTIDGVWIGEWIY
jgi:hypothetical protein